MELDGNHIARCQTIEWCNAVGVLLRA